ncbi:hypothetical protein ACFQAS_03360 [Halopenitus salinus]|jgi:hypothetical protein|uniref:Uncharacterized protein n=1 Tax=Halopenitus salinus TaxID=1198295 RepID=A0ABD5UQR8_9EURY
MSNTTLRSNAPLPTRLRRRTGDQLRAIAFWAAVLLPLTYIPVLHGIVVEASAQLFVGLLGLNVVCAIVGHEHGINHDGRERDARMQRRTNGTSTTDASEMTATESRS